MKENVQLEPPALLGRKQRIKDFKQFIEANRKDRTAKRIVSLYALETGIARRTVDGYLKLFIEADVYMKPNWNVCKNKLLTPKEYKVASAEWKRRVVEANKKREEEEAKSFGYETD